jgi:hypothetical protein
MNNKQLKTNKHQNHSMLLFCHVVVSLCATGKAVRETKKPFFPSLQRKLESRLL